MNAADSMQLISIVIAVNALISGLFLWGVNKDRKDIKNNLLATEKHAQYMEQLTHQLVEWMISKDVHERTERGMLYRALRSLGKTSELDTHIKNTHPLQTNCKRNQQHLMLYSSNKIRRDSAYKQLINAYGNADTLKIMEDLANTAD